MSLVSGVWNINSMVWSRQAVESQLMANGLQVLSVSTTDQRLCLSVGFSTCAFWCLLFQTRYVFGVSSKLQRSGPC